MRAMRQIKENGSLTPSKGHANESIFYVRPVLRPFFVYWIVEAACPSICEQQRKRVMAKTRDYMDYLDEFVEISPANSEEEYQAAGVIAGILKEHELETSVESFETHPAGAIVLPILTCLMFVSLVVTGVTEGSVHYGTLVLSMLLAGLSAFSHFSDTNIFRNFGPASQSQNVVGVHRATGDKVVKGARPIVIVAHYDTPRESLMRKGPLSRVQTSLPRIASPLTIAIIAMLLLQAIPVLPGTIRTFLWVLGVLLSLPLLFLSVMNIYEHFAPCTLGANDNKSSVAALLSIANKVHPHEDRVDKYIADGNESLLRRAGDKPVAPPTPTYVEVVEETKGVRHGMDVLLSLGILPATCDVVYEEPRVTMVQENVNVETQEVEDVADEGLDEPQDEAMGFEEDPLGQMMDEPVVVEDVPIEEQEEEVPFDVEEQVDETAEEYPVADEEAYDEEQDYDEEDYDEEDYLEENYDDEIYDDEDLYEDEEAPSSIGTWLKDRWSDIREFFSKDRGADMGIDRGADRTQVPQEPADETEEAEEEFVDAEDESESFDYEPNEDEQDAEVVDYESSDQDEAYVDDDEYVYLEDLEPEPLEFEDDEDLTYEEAPADEYFEEDDYYYESDDAELESDDVEPNAPEAEEEPEEELEEYEEDYADEYTEFDEDAPEEEEEFPVYDDMPTQIIEEERLEEFDLDEEEYQEEGTYDGHSRYEEYEELEDEERAPSFIERIKMFFRDLRESHDQDIYEFEEYAEEYEAEGHEEDEAYDEGDSESVTQQDDTNDEESAYVAEEPEEFEDDDLYYDDTLEVEEPVAEDASIEPYGEVEIESPLPEDFDQPLERPADPNVLHFDYEEDSDILPRDTTGLDTISDSYDLYSGEVDRVTRRDKPVPVEDPSWGVTSYQPARPAVNIARRAALLDLPDPSEAFVDPISNVGYNGFSFSDYVEDEYDAYAMRNSSIDESQEASYESEEDAPLPESDYDLEESYDEYLEEDYSDLDEVRDDDVEAHDDMRRKSFWGRSETSDWKGGATSRADLREDDDSPIIIDVEDLQDAILEMGDEYLVAHDIWFVATGASETDHAGIKAFMEGHARDIRGAFLVNLDSIGAGSLSVVVREGINVSKRADRRLVRMLTSIAQDLHIQVETAMQNWTDHESTIAMRKRIRSVTIMGLDENDLPANAHTASDVPENVNPRQVSNVVRIITELIRRS